MPVGMATRRSVLATFGALAAATALPSAAGAQRGRRLASRLRLGDTVGLVEPAGFSSGPEQIEAVLHTIRGMGLVPKLGRHVGARHGYLAGADEQRAEDLNAVFEIGRASWRERR